MTLKIILLFLFFISVSPDLWACESCLLSRTGRDENQTIVKTEDGKFFLKYWFERQEWEETDPHAAHELHHDGHHVHVKTSESIQHLGLGYRWNNRLLTTLDLPYVRRSALEIESHANLGKEFTSQGWGDATVTAQYGVWENPSASANVVLGIKLPTGSTHELNTVGGRFEPEMQPGTGSWDYHLGGVYQRSMKYIDLTANMLYVLKTQGAQDYAFGNVFSTSFFVDYVPPQNGVFKDLRPGTILNWKEEARHEDDGQKIPDSGGTTILAGPELAYVPNDRFKLFGNMQWPIYQNLGGVHQEIKWIWNAGAQIAW